MLLVVECKVYVRNRRPSSLTPNFMALLRYASETIWIKATAASMSEEVRNVPVSSCSLFSVNHRAHTVMLGCLCY
jgi:hypothetical protein